MELRKQINFLSPLLTKYRYRKKADPFRIFNTIKTKDKIRDHSKGSVLLLPIRVSPTSNLFEGMLGYALKLRGYEVSALLCGQSLPICENVNMREFFPVRCSLCLSEQNRFCEAFSVIKLNYNNVVETVTEKILLHISKETDLDDIFGFKYKGVNVGIHVKYGLFRYLLASNIDIRKYESIIRKYFFTSLLTAEATLKALDKINPKFTLISHGIYSTWGPALEACNLKGCHAVVWGRGYIGQGNIIASHNQSYHLNAIEDDRIFWESSDVPENIKEELQKYFSLKREPKSRVDHVNYYRDNDGSRVDIVKELNLRDNRFRIGVYPNIPWDGTTFRATEAFPDLKSFAHAIVEWGLQNRDVDIIVRAHPAEVFRDKLPTNEKFLDILKSLGKELPENIYYIPPDHKITSYDLSNVCDLALLYGSTLSLELAFFGHSVLQVGKSNVSNKDFVFEANDKEQFFKMLDQAKFGNLKMTDQMKNNVIKYARYWVFNRHMPETLVELESLSFKKYLFNSSSQLKKDCNEILDWFIECCEKSKPFVLPDDLSFKESNLIITSGEGLVVKGKEKV